MIEWFRAGGVGMFVILFLGLAAVALGVRAVLAPTSAHLAAVRSMPSLIVVCALGAFGTNLWTVQEHLSNSAFLTARDIGEGQLPFIAMMGFAEAGQALSLGGMLATIVLVLRAVADVKHARITADAR